MSHRSLQASPKIYYLLVIQYVSNQDSGLEN